MNKSERIGLTLALLTLFVAIGAWLFPASNNSLTYIYKEEASTPTLVVPKTLEASKPIYQEPKKLNTYETLEFNVPLITEISLPLFVSELKRNSLDSGKISYITENKHLVKGRIPFYELNNILSLISLDSNKIDAARLLVGQVSPPSEDDIEAYSKLFNLSSNRRTALALVYGK